MWVAFRSEARVVLNQLPSPKLQFHIVGVPPVEVSVNCTASGTVPDEVLVMKAAVSAGGEVTVIVLPDDNEILPAFEMVR